MVKEYSFSIVLKKILQSILLISFALFYAQDDIAVVPSINAEMNVNESGALTYNMPIDVIKGVNSFQPNLSLSYNSQSGSGIAGWGWNIVGLSQINRGGKSQYLDGLTQGVQFDNKDPLYLDGQRLIFAGEVGEPDDPKDALYVTEKLSKIKITMESGGMHIIVQYTDGKVAVYKQLAFEQYYIISMTDAFNNSIHYTYTIQNNVVRISKVSYGGFSEATDKYSVNFSYKQKKFPAKAYRNGTEYISSNVLDYITVNSTVSGLYRKYALTHDLASNQNERLVGIEVLNSKGEKLKPLKFTYDTTYLGSVDTVFDMAPKMASDTKALGDVAFGDFLENNDITPIYERGITDENNSLPVYERKTKFEIMLPNGQTLEGDGTKLLSGKGVLPNKKLSQFDQLIYYKVDYQGIPDPYNYNTSSLFNDRVTLNFYNVKTSSNSKKVYLNLQGGFLKYWSNPNHDSDFWLKRDKRRKFESLDYNNDGLIDLLVLEEQNNNTQFKVSIFEIGKAQDNETLLPSVSTIIYAYNYKVNDQYTDVISRIYPIEFDGDGIPEIMFVEHDKKYSLYKFNFQSKTLAPINSQQNIVLNNFSDKTPVLFGDYNGDGLTDFLYPQKMYSIQNSSVAEEFSKMNNEQLLWWEGISTGTTYATSVKDFTAQKLVYIASSTKNYIKETSFWDKLWNSKQDYYDYSEYATASIIASDINNDGKTDLISVRKVGKAKYNLDGYIAQTDISNLDYSSPLSDKIVFHINTNTNVNGNAGYTFVNDPNVIDIHTRKISPFSLILGYSTYAEYLENNNYKVGVKIFDPHQGAITKYSHINGYFLEGNIRRVENGSNVLQEVEYQPMFSSEDLFERAYTYKELNFEYPYYAHKYMGSLYLVTKVHTIADYKAVTKQYHYENAIQNLSGKGFLGFQKLYVSDAFESTYINGSLQPKYSTDKIFWTIQTRDPFMDNTTVKVTYGGLNKFFTETSLTLKKYDKYLQTVILTDNEEVKDNLRNTFINKKYVYDENDDLKLKEAYTNYGGVSETTSKYTYTPEFSNGLHYFYGKIAISESIMQRDGAIFKGREEFTYDPSYGSVLKNTKYSNDVNTLPIINTYEYDNSTGNILSKTQTTANIAPLKTSYEYDVSKRFIEKIYTPDTLFSTFSVNDIGLVTSETSPLGLSTIHQYDSWGNNIKNVDYLGKATSLQKSNNNLPVNGAYRLSKKKEGNPETITIFDKFDREIETRTQSINSKWVVVKTEYDILGRKTKYSEPFFDGETPKWNLIEYDDLNRPIKNTTFTGKIITTCYEGSKVTVDDGNKKLATTFDPLGNKIKVQDHGGIIKYTYFPNGSVKQVDYEGIKTDFDIDGWGNKSKLTDATVGTFKYEYDSLGRIVQEVMPKGYSVYEYDNIGRIISEKIYGNTPAENTNIEKQYYYKGQTQLPEKIVGTSNGQTFTYSCQYDQYYRLIEKTEENIEFIYKTSTAYDNFGRVDIVNLSTKLKNNAYTSLSSLKNIYDSNGLIIQQNDNETGKMISRTSEVSALGQKIFTEYGNGYSSSRTYNPMDNSLQKILDRDSSGRIAIDIDYVYDVNKGIINSRKDNVFSKNETFEYDNLNRLIAEYENNIKVNEYTYDYRGRITSNSEVGKYSYNPNDYKLQNVTFNTNGQDVAANRGFADINYNAYKSPVKISLSGKDELNFEYNILKTRFSMKSAATGKQKFYSSDFSIEIIKDNTNKTTLITYLDGDPYSASYIKKETIENGTLTDKQNYFLHRDNLRSIIAISATDGKIIEQRRFDAWGNLKSIIDKNGNKISEPKALANYEPIIDRGYTGHEHLWKVGLINMNARIYDPILRKFLSPDILVADPYNTQNYDRYGYVMNNPLSTVDLDGNEALTLAAAAVYMVYAVAIAVTTKMVMNAINGVEFWYGIGKSATVGAISGVISMGIGSVATSLFSEALTFGKALFEAGMHAYTAGIMSVADGGSFGSGALSGAVSSLLASGVNALGINYAASKEFGGTVLNGFGNDYMQAAMIVAGGLGGGFSSTIAGGNFWDGMKQGLITSGLNHVFHVDLGKEEKDSILAILKDTEGASGFGHMGLGGGNDEKGWSYLSKDGRADTNKDGNQDGTLVTGGKSTQTYEINKFKTLADLLKAHPQYDTYVTYKVTYQQVQLAFKIGYQSSLTNYHVLFSNCGHTVGEALSAVGLYGGIGTTPNDRFKTIQHFIKTGSVFHQSTRAFAP